MILRYKYMFVSILAMLHKSKNQTDCTAGNAYLTVAVEIKKNGCDMKIDIKWLARNICRLWMKEENKSLKYHL